MRVIRDIVIALAAALAVAGAANAQPPASRLAAASNFTHAQRKPSAIRFVVIHVNEGSFLGTVSWLRNPEAHASANFVVGRAGEVQELVPLHDIAWRPATGRTTSARSGSRTKASRTARRASRRPSTARARGSPA
jgi:N-acetyl-anhydromuramyl-L-alanine amidase AmpD